MTRPHTEFVKRGAFCGMEPKPSPTGQRKEFEIMEEQTLTNADAYEGWAIVELMGHRVIAGRVQEVSQFGAAQLRVDVPRGDGVTAVTQFYGGAAIYALTPCSEEAALKALERRYNLPEPVRMALPESAPAEPDQLGDDFDDHHYN